MSEQIPKRITDDQYDKLSRKLWEFEQRLQGTERATLDSVAMDKMFEKMNEMEQKITTLVKDNDTLKSMICLLSTAEMFRVKKFIDKIPDTDKISVCQTTHSSLLMKN